MRAFKHLFKSSVVHGAGKHLSSSPSEQVFPIPASRSSRRSLHILGHLVITRSKSPKPSNSFQSIDPSKFLSADFTRERRIILDWTARDWKYRNWISDLGKVLTMGVRSWVREATTWGGSPSRANPSTISFKPTLVFPGLPAKNWKTRRIVPTSSCSVTWIASIL